MPPEEQEPKPRTLDEVAREFGPYPPEAYEFVQRGLSYTVEQVHAAVTDPEAGRHVTGRQLCNGLREYALKQWGLMARTVLRRWEIHSTLDFGNIVFTLIKVEQMQKTDEDSIEDFRDVYDFRTAFESGYQIQTA